MPVLIHAVYVKLIFQYSQVWYHPHYQQSVQCQVMLQVYQASQQDYQVRSHLLHLLQAYLVCPVLPQQQLQHSHQPLRVSTMQLTFMVIIHHIHVDGFELILGNVRSFVSWKQSISTVLYHVVCVVEMILHITSRLHGE